MNRLVYISAIIIFAAFAASAQESNAIFYQSLAWSPDGKYLTMTGMRDQSKGKDDESRHLHNANGRLGL